MTSCKRKSHEIRRRERKIAAARSQRIRTLSRIPDTGSACDQNPKPIALPHRVVAVYHNQPAHLIRIFVNDQMVRVTPNHPFYVNNSGWTAAGNLKVGDRLLSTAGLPASVTAIEDFGEVEPVFNLQVADDHTYFVQPGLNSPPVLVHNDSTATTQQSMPTTAAGWQASILQQLGVNPNDWNPDKYGYFEMANNNPSQSSIVSKIYEYYKEMYQNNPNLQWAGMARLARRSVIDGLDQVQNAEVTANIVAAGGGGDIATLSALGAEKLQQISSIMLNMQKAIFYDIGWVQYAYEEGGMAALNVLLNNHQLPQEVYDAFKEIDDGAKTNNQKEILDGNVALLHREQSTVLGPYYKKLAAITGVAGIMSQSITNPIPGGRGFSGSDVTNFDQRWNWIMQEMVAPWSKMSVRERLENMDGTLRSNSSFFGNLGDY